MQLVTSTKEFCDAILAVMQRCK